MKKVREKLSTILGIVCSVILLCGFLFLINVIGPTEGVIIKKYKVPEIKTDILEMSNWSLIYKTNSNDYGQFFKIKTSWYFVIDRWVSSDIYEKYNVGDKIKWRLK